MSGLASLDQAMTQECFFASDLASRTSALPGLLFGHGASPTPSTPMNDAPKIEMHPMRELPDGTDDAEAIAPAVNAFHAATGKRSTFAHRCI